MSATGGSHASCEARAVYSDGRNCAEAVMSALADTAGTSHSPVVLGSGFTGGIGHSGCVCGALAGGVAVLGNHASTAGLEPVATRILAEELSAELHARFAARWGAACCRVIKRGQVVGSDEWQSECAELAEWTAATTLEIIAAHASQAARLRWAALDVRSAVRRAASGVLAAGALAATVAALTPPAARELVAITIGGVLTIVAVVLEVRGPAARRAGRVLRVAGALGAAGLLAAVALMPAEAARSLLRSLLADSLASTAFRGVLALAAVAAAATAAFGLKRYR